MGVYGFANPITRTITCVRTEIPRFKDMLDVEWAVRVYPLEVNARHSVSLPASPHEVDIPTVQITGICDQSVGRDWIIYGTTLHILPYEGMMSDRDLFISICKHKPNGLQRAPDIRIGAANRRRLIHDGTLRMRITRSSLDELKPLPNDPFPEPLSNQLPYLSDRMRFLRERGYLSSQDRLEVAVQTTKRKERVLLPWTTVGDLVSKTYDQGASINEFYEASDIVFPRGRPAPELTRLAWAAPRRGYN